MIGGRATGEQRKSKVIDISGVAGFRSVIEYNEERGRCSAANWGLKVTHSRIEQ